MVRLFGLVIPVALLGATAVASPGSEPAQVEEQQQFSAAIDAVFAEMMRPGPRQEGWDKGGVDIYKLVEAAPGGLSGNYLLMVDKDGERSILVIRAEDPNSLIPKNWKAQIHAGSSTDAAGAHTLVIAGLDGPFYMAGWENRRSVGDAFCSTGNIGGDLYEDVESKAAGELPRHMIPALFHATAAQLEKAQLCWRYDRDGDGFKVSYFLEDGRSLPGLTEAGERVTIIRAGPIEQLLAKPDAAE